MADCHKIICIHIMSYRYFFFLHDRKKLSNFTHSDDWKHAQNYVAKHYFEDVSRDVYFEDVKLQMDTKLWGEEYNRHNPPKKV